MPYQVKRVVGSGRRVPVTFVRSGIRHLKIIILFQNDINAVTPLVTEDPESRGQERLMKHE